MELEKKEERKQQLMAHTLIEVALPARASTIDTSLTLLKVARSMTQNRDMKVGFDTKYYRL